MAQLAYESGLAITRPDGSTIPIPIGAVPLVVDDRDIESLNRVAVLLTHATLRVARWRMAPERRDATLAALSPTERRVIAATWHRDAGLAVARVDFLGSATRQALEVNATIPAMQAYSDIAAAAWLSTHASDIRKVGALLAANGSNSEALLQALLDLYERQRGGSPRTIALLCRRLDAQRTELLYLRERFEAAGFDARLVHPEDLTWDGSRGLLRHRGQALDLVYRHIFLRLLDEAPAPAVEAALMHDRPNGTLVLNPASAHLEMKSTHAFLSQAADDDRLSADIGLTDDERAIVQRHVPWTRMLHSAQLSERELKEVVARVSAEPAEFVLKRSWSYGGNEVFVGAAVAEVAGNSGGSPQEYDLSARSWAQRIEQAAGDHRSGGFVVQRRVRSPRSRQLLCTPNHVQSAEVITDYAAFATLGAAPSWTGVARAASGEIVNLARGGVLVPVIRRSVLEALQATRAQHGLRQLVVGHVAAAPHCANQFVARKRPLALFHHVGREVEHAPWRFQRPALTQEVARVGVQLEMVESVDHGRAPPMARACFARPRILPPHPKQPAPEGMNLCG
ncbi:MAG TPA: glutathionylspermidine synthase family protein [Xanthomonadaceae bacterium]|nr:glutathionylspermidine synthase family protein [Xanthomonadaceae bacterium]